MVVIVLVAKLLVIKYKSTTVILQQVGDERLLDAHVQLEPNKLTAVPLGRALNYKACTLLHLKNEGYKE